MNHYRLFFLSIIMAFSAAAAMAGNSADSLAYAADREPKNAGLNLKAGQALYESGLHKKARTYLERAGNEGQPWIALIEFADYDFDKASETASKYLESKHNAESKGHEVAEEVVDRCALAVSMLDRVEKVIVIDSIVVPKKTFFEAYRIAAPTGRISDRTMLPKGMPAADPTTVYITEDGDRMLWGAKDADGKVRIVETNHLADGSWEKPRSVADNLGLGGNANFPFLLSDGMTLYYATDGEGSLGGYDIYMTRNDGDRYLNPQNIGMPYNSPMDDYLLAIDDITGVGWWATDRNLIPDSLTIYVFVPQELRDNFPVDGTPDLVDKARITSVAATRRQGEDYSRLLKAIRNTAPSHGASAEGTAAFAFTMPDGRIIKSLSQFTEPRAADLMRQYLAARDELEEHKKELNILRRRYAKGDTSVSDRILQEETTYEQLVRALNRMANDVIIAETGQQY